MIWASPGASRFWVRYGASDIALASVDVLKEDFAAAVWRATHAAITERGGGPALSEQILGLGVDADRVSNLFLDGEYAGKFSHAGWNEDAGSLAAAGKITELNHAIDLHRSLHTSGVLSAPRLRYPITPIVGSQDDGEVRTRDRDSMIYTAVKEALRRVLPGVNVSDTELITAVDAVHGATRSGKVLISSITTTLLRSVGRLRRRATHGLGELGRPSSELTAADAIRVTESTSERFARLGYADDISKMTAAGEVATALRTEVGINSFYIAVDSEESAAALAALARAASEYARALEPIDDGVESTSLHSVKGVWHRVLRAAGDVRLPNGQQELRLREQTLRGVLAVLRTSLQADAGYEGKRRALRRRLGNIINEFGLIDGAYVARAQLKKLHEA